MRIIESEIETTKEESLFQVNLKDDARNQQNFKQANIGRKIVFGKISEIVMGLMMQEKKLSAQSCRSKIGIFNSVVWLFMGYQVVLMASY